MDASNRWADERYPDAEPDLRTREVRDLPEPGELHGNTRGANRMRDDEAERQRQAAERQKAVDARKERTLAAAGRAVRWARWSAIWAGVAAVVAIGAAVIAAWEP